MGIHSLKFSLLSFAVRNSDVSWATGNQTIKDMKVFHLNPIDIIWVTFTPWQGCGLKALETGWLLHFPVDCICSLAIDRAFKIAFVFNYWGFKICCWAGTLPFTWLQSVWQLRSLMATLFNVSHNHLPVILNCQTSYGIWSSEQKSHSPLKSLDDRGKAMTVSTIWGEGWSTRRTID